MAPVREEEGPASMEESRASEGWEEEEAEVMESYSDPVRVVEGEAQILMVWSRPQEMSRRWVEALSLQTEERGKGQHLELSPFFRELTRQRKKPQTHAEKQRPLT